MHSFRETRIMHHDAEFIAKIIMDIEEYPAFLPWCNSASILSRDEDSITAILEVSFKGFKESYTSKVVLDENANSYKINTQAISGPFKYLENIWDIRQIENGCEINFSIDFKFKSSILDIVMGAIFSIATKKMIQAFEDRANKLLCR